MRGSTVGAWLLGGCVAFAVACGSSYDDVEPLPSGDAGSSGGNGGTDAAAPDGGGPPTGALPDCRAQRVVHLLAGTGGLAWFTQLWPLPHVIQSYVPAFAIDRANIKVVASTLTGDGAHPLYTRSLGEHLLFDGPAYGTNPQVTAFVAGRNQTHTNTAATMRTTGGSDILALGALAQRDALAPKVPVMVVGPSAYFAQGVQPEAVTTPTVMSGIGVLTTAASLSPADVTDLTPSSATAEAWAGPGSTAGGVAPAKHRQLAEGLLFAANAFRRGLVGTMMLHAVEDDPHLVFADGAEPTATSDALARMLESFYVELGKYQEPSCGFRGAPLSLADNVVLVISGDTPKNGFAREGWADGTTMASNQLFARGNGYLKPGWYGGLTPTARTGFVPGTGDPTTSSDPDAVRDAALAGILFAITRGDTTLIAQATDIAHAGVTKTP